MNFDFTRSASFWRSSWSLAQSSAKPYSVVYLAPDKTREHHHDVPLDPPLLEHEFRHQGFKLTIRGLLWVIAIQTLLLHKFGDLAVVCIHIQFVFCVCLVRGIFRVFDSAKPKFPLV